VISHQSRPIYRRLCQLSWAELIQHRNRRVTTESALVMSCMVPNMHNASKPSFKPELCYLFKAVPREIRDEIYRLVLCSPTGIILFHRLPAPWNEPFGSRYRIFTRDDTGQEEICLSFIRTCKQIYEEVGDMFWKHNAVDLSMIPGGYSILPFGYVIVRLQSVELDLIIGDDVRQHGQLLERLERDMAAVQRWNEKYALNKVTLNLRESSSTASHSPNYMMGKLFRLTKLMHRSPRIFRKYRKIISQTRRNFNLPGSGGVKQRLVIAAGDCYPFNKAGFPGRWIPACRGDPMELLGVLHKAWGGSLWFDGREVYRHGKELIQVFQRFPEGEPARPEDIFYLREEVKQAREMWFGEGDFDQAFKEEVQRMQRLMAHGPTKEDMEEVKQRVRIQFGPDQSSIRLFETRYLFT